MSHQIEFEDSIGEDNFPVLVRVSVEYEPPEPEAGLSGGWVCCYDEHVKDEERWTPEHGEMPHLSDGQITAWEERAGQIADEEKRDDDTEMLRHV